MGTGTLSQAPVPVLAADVLETTVPLELPAVGTVEAYSTVQIKAQVAGQLVSAHFREGQEVHKGDLLFRIDSRPFEALLRQQEANLVRDQVEAENAKVSQRRIADLVKAGSATEDDLDRTRTTADSKAAQVEADKAAIQYARLQLEYCEIRSPIDGRTGAIVVQPGNLVKANDTPALVVINQISPIYVSFSVPEQTLPAIQRLRREGRRLRVVATIPGDEGSPLAGELTFVDTEVDRNTGTIRLKGDFENRDHRLWPGLFVNVVLVLEEQPNCLVIPSHAIQVGQQGTYVYVIRSDQTVELRPVTVKRAFGTNSMIETGLRAGERVVTDGQLRLASGSRVEVKPGLTMSSSSPGQ